MFARDGGRVAGGGGGIKPLGGLGGIWGATAPVFIHERQMIHRRHAAGFGGRGEKYVGFRIPTLAGVVEDVRLAVGLKRESAVNADVAVR